MVVVDVVMKSIMPTEQTEAGIGGALVTYDIQALHTTEEGLRQMLEAAARSGVFARAIRGVGYPEASVDPVMTARNVTPEGAAEGNITLEIQQVVWYSVVCWRAWCDVV